MRKLELNLDSLYENGYLYSDYDIGGRGHSIIINANDRENFLDDYAKQFRKIVEDYLEDYDEDSD